MAKAIKRLSKEITNIRNESPPGVLDMHCTESDMHCLHFLIAGPPDTPFEGGVYVLKIQLPPDYPMRAPDFIMYTPNGRFQTGCKICTSFSAFHPESWTPSYTLTTLVLSFISFFAEPNSVAHGVVHESPQTRRALAEQSVEWCKQHNYVKMLPALASMKPGLQPTRGSAAAEAAAAGSKAAASAAAAAPQAPAALPRACKAPIALTGGEPAAKRSRKAPAPAAAGNSGQGKPVAGPVDLTAAVVQSPPRTAARSSGVAVDLSGSTQVHVAQQSAARAKPRVDMGIVDLT